MPNLKDTAFVVAMILNSTSAVACFQDPCPRDSRTTSLGTSAMIVEGLKSGDLILDKNGQVIHPNGQPVIDTIYTGMQTDVTFSAKRPKPKCFEVTQHLAQGGRPSSPPTVTHLICE